MTITQLNLKGRDFIEFTDYSKEEIEYLLQLAIDIKKKQKSGEVYQPLKGKTIGLIFEKSSTRTRVSFEVGMFQLGGHALFLSKMTFSLDAVRPSATRLKCSLVTWMGL